MFLVLWIVFTIVIAVGAHQSGRHGGIWGCCAFLFSPLLVGVILLFVVACGGRIKREEA